MFGKIDLDRHARTEPESGVFSMDKNGEHTVLRIGGPCDPVNATDDSLLGETRSSEAHVSTYLDPGEIFFVHQDFDIHTFDVNDFKLNNFKEKITKYEKLKNQTKNESEILFFEKKIKEANTVIEILN